MRQPAYIFVYGTLRRDAGHRAHGYIERFFVWVGKGSVKGKLFDAIEYPAGVPTNEECRIVGELYKLKEAEDFDRAMRVLDEYEGCYDGPSLFRRAMADVMMNDGIVKAWIYWYNRPVTGMRWIKSGDFLQPDF